MIEESLSAFLDGECDAEESEYSIHALTRDKERRAAWQRQLWLREVLRGDGMPPHDPGFADRVAAALAEEDTDDKVVPIATRQRRWLGPAAGLAAAASVAAAAVLVADPLSLMRTQDAAPAATFTAGADTTPATSEGTTLSVADGVSDVGRSANDRGQRSDHWSVSDPEVEDQLNGYLIEHNGLARSYGLSGATPSFVRVATYGQE